MLDKEQVNGHFIFVLVGDFWDAGKEPFAVLFGVEVGHIIAEIELKRRIGDDVVESHQLVAVAVVRQQQGVALDDVLDGVDEVVEDKVEAQHAGGFLRDVLRIDCAAVFADGMRQVHEQRARTCRRVVAGDVAHRPVNKNGGHDLRHGMRGVVLGVFAAAVLVIVFDEVLEDGGEEVKLLSKHLFEAEVDQLVDEGFAEVVALRAVGDVVAQFVEEGDLGAGSGFHRKDVAVVNGDVAQDVVEVFGKFWFILPVVKAGEEMFPFEPCAVGVHFQQEHFVLPVGISGDFLLPVFCLFQGGFKLFHFINELVVHEFIEKHLGDDLEFVAVVSQSVSGTNAFEVVNERFGLRSKILCCHAA